MSVNGHGGWIGFEAGTLRVGSWTAVEDPDSGAWDVTWTFRYTPEREEILRIRDLARLYERGVWSRGGFGSGPGPNSLDDLISALHARSFVPRPRRLIGWFFPERN